MSGPSIDVLLGDLRLGHSEFQLDHFVVAANGVTVWGAYQQTLRELRARKGAIDVGEIELKRADLRARKAEDPDEFRTGFAVEEAALDAECARLAYADVRRLQEDRRREYEHLRKLAEALRAKLLMGGPLTPSRVQELDAEHWYRVVRHRCGLELQAAGRIEGSTMQLIAVLPPALRGRLAAELQPAGLPALMNSALNLPSPVALLEAGPC